jgi:hypothetical protein
LKIKLVYLVSALPKVPDYAKSWIQLKVTQTEATGTLIIEGRESTISLMLTELRIYAERHDAPYPEVEIIVER